MIQIYPENSYANIRIEQFQDLLQLYLTHAWHLLHAPELVEKTTKSDKFVLMDKNDENDKNGKISTVSSKHVYVIKVCKSEYSNL